MAVKKVYEIKDLILHDSFEVSGQSGVMELEQDGLMLLDFNQMAQYIVENSYVNEHEISEKSISAMCNQWSNEIAKIILDEIYNSAISDVKDDDEVQLIK